MSEIKKIIKDRKGRPKGILIGVSVGDNVHIGFSSCKECDKFNKRFGTEIARRRALNGSYKMPFIIQDEIPYFRDRCKRYFKDKCVADPHEVKEIPVSRRDLINV